MATATKYNKRKVSTCSHIHNDIALSILYKLPIKSLTRFTCVQKSWSLLFQNPKFMDMFRINFFVTKQDDHDDTTRLLLKQSTREIPFHDPLYILSGDRFEDRVRLDWPAPFLENDSGVRILGSSSVNGIFCLFKGYGFIFTTILWNPATKQFKLVPPSHQPVECNTQPVGFGYDPVREDYKVLRVADYPLCFEGNWVWLPEANNRLWEMHESLDEMLDNDDEFWDGRPLDMYDPFWEIYSLKSNSWKKIEGFDVPYPWPGSSQVNLNEFCHWIGPQSAMVSFDFRKEKFFSMELPFDSDIMKIELPLKRRLERQLLVLNGSVSFILTFKMNMAVYFHIWILGELHVKESWTKFSIVGPLTCNVMRPIGAGKKSHIFFRIRNKDDDDELAWYDFRTQRISEIRDKGKLVSLQIVTYKENLVPFGGMIN